eukprot:303674-Karenia_brevis.AAC.1
MPVVKCGIPSQAGMHLAPGDWSQCRTMVYASTQNQYVTGQDAGDRSGAEAGASENIHIESSGASNADADLAWTSNVDER